jgi:hypothetical protein
VEAEINTKTHETNMKTDTSENRYRPNTIGIWTKSR